MVLGLLVPSSPSGQCRRCGLQRKSTWSRVLFLHCPDEVLLNTITALGFSFSWWVSQFYNVPQCLNQKMKFMFHCVSIECEKCLYFESSFETARNQNYFPHFNSWVMRLNKSGPLKWKSTRPRTRLCVDCLPNQKNGLVASTIFSLLYVYITWKSELGGKEGEQWRLHQRLLPSWICSLTQKEGFSQKPSETPQSFSPNLYFPPSVSTLIEGADGISFTRMVVGFSPSIFAFFMVGFFLPHNWIWVRILDEYKSECSRVKSQEHLSPFVSSIFSGLSINPSFPHVLVSMISFPVVLSKLEFCCFEPQSGRRS